LRPSLATIAAELQGYDPQALRVNEVNAFLSRLAEPVTEHEYLDLFQALGRVLALDLVSPINVPGHDNSAMDGYAFRSDDLVPDPALKLKVVGTALAGEAWRGDLARGECDATRSRHGGPEGNGDLTR
jgi:molybdopterin molybdotransferase